MIELRVTPVFPGPTILELDAVIGEIQGTIEVQWKGTKPEYTALERHHNRKFIIHVPDLQAMERAATILGQPFIFENALLTAALTSLASRKSYNWRSFTDDMGFAVTRGILTRLSAGACRHGKTHPITNVASEVILEGINPIDADVLLRLSVLRGH